MPVSIPAGTEMAILRVRASVPTPPHAEHGSLTTLPSPPHLPQVETCMNWPKMLWAARRTSPVPPQFRQVTGLLSGSLRVPMHLPHTSVRLISRSFSTPKAASSKSRSRVMRRSAPRRAVDRVRAPPPKNASNMSPEAAEVGEALEARAAVRVHAGVAQPVVPGPLLGVGQHLVGLVDLLEALGGVGAPVPVGVVLQRELPERLSHLFVGSGSGQPQDLVVVSLLGGHGRTAALPAADASYQLAHDVGHQVDDRHGLLVVHPDRADGGDCARHLAGDPVPADDDSHGL